MDNLTYKEQQGLTRLMIVMASEEDTVLGSLEKKGFVTLLDYISKLIQEIEEAKNEILELKKTMDTSDR